MSEKPTVYGAPYSVYVRIVLLTLLAKDVDYKLTPVDVFNSDDSNDRCDISPFGKIPTFSHQGFDLFETGAITRYIDDVFDTQPLMPASATERARVNQIISMMDNYAYPAMVWGIYVPLQEGRVDTLQNPEFKKSVSTSQLIIETLSNLTDSKSNFLTGDQLTLADLYAAPMFYYFSKTPIGHKLINDNVLIKKWWERIYSLQICKTVLDVE